jgi:glycosyltransferase involved in cell wall biosynthesis
MRFGFMGGFQLHKGISHVLDAATALKGEGLIYELHIWGPGGEGREAEIAARDLSDRVHLNGMYTPDQRWSVYNQVDTVLVATTVSETLSLVPLEAAAVGAPTIAPAIGGLRESIQDGVNGLLYPFREPSGLARQMRRMLTEPGLFARVSSPLGPGVDSRVGGAAVEAALQGILAGANASQLSRG